jgi:hypothetical protein
MVFRRIAVGQYKGPLWKKASRAAPPFAPHELAEFRNVLGLHIDRGASNFLDLGRQRDQTAIQACTFTMATKSNPI